MPFSDKQPGPVRGLPRPALEADTSNRARSARCVVVETRSLRNRAQQLLTDADPRDRRRRSHPRGSALVWADRPRAPATVALRKRARQRVRQPGGAKAIMRPAPGRDRRCDSDVAVALVGSGEVATIALEECNRRADGLGPQNRAVRVASIEQAPTPPSAEKQGLRTNAHEAGRPAARPVAQVARCETDVVYRVETCVRVGACARSQRGRRESLLSRKGQRSPAVLASTLVATSLKLGQCVHGVDAAAVPGGACKHRPRTKWSSCLVARRTVSRSGVRLACYRRELFEPQLVLGLAAAALPGSTGASRRS